ncbi:hypothetical protein [Mastigocladopsis repens]|uniref:hypothetical protein n=1 Tax=Mastigocladopsis repens TaxID=221287 RepID=UPI000474DE6B|nr:hypothetical protein [Mastigocladopsis repens]
MAKILGYIRTLAKVIFFEKNHRWTTDTCYNGGLRGPHGVGLGGNPPPDSPVPRARETPMADATPYGERVCPMPAAPPRALA